MCKVYSLRLHPTNLIKICNDSIFDPPDPELTKTRFENAH